MTLPLEGVLVVAVEQAAASPFASCRLADADARAIKIEKPGDDFGRGYDAAVHGDCNYFVWLNQDKESIELDFAKPADLALLHEMVAHADVLNQHIGPGAAGRAGFGWSEMRARHPRLITCDITGYGEEGPFAMSRAYDLLVEAECGIASVTGTPDAPGRISVSACDIGAGMYAHAVILEALPVRHLTGEGNAIDVSPFDSMCDWMNVPRLHQDYAGTSQPRVGLSHPTIAPYGAFAVADGQQLLVWMQNDGEWQHFANGVLRRPDLAAQDPFATNHGRVKHRCELDAAVAAVLATMTIEEARESLAQAKVAYASVNTVAELSVHPHLRRITVETAGGEVSMAAPPYRFCDQPRRYGAVPTLDQYGPALRSEFGQTPA